MIHLTTQAVPPHSCRAHQQLKRFCTYTTIAIIIILLAVPWQQCSRTRGSCAVGAQAGCPCVVVTTAMHIPGPDCCAAVFAIRMHPLLGACASAVVAMWVFVHAAHSLQGLGAPSRTEHGLARGCAGSGCAVAVAVHLWSMLGVRQMACSPCCGGSHAGTVCVQGQVLSSR